MGVRVIRVWLTGRVYRRGPGGVNRGQGHSRLRDTLTRHDAGHDGGEDEGKDAGR